MLKNYMDYFRCKDNDRTRDFISLSKREDINVCVWGAGRLGRTLGKKILDFLNVKIDYYCDKNSNLINTEIVDGIICKSEEELIRNKDNTICFIMIGHANAESACDYLVKKGVPFREAHAIVGRMVLFAEKANKALDDLTLSEMKECSEYIEEDIYEAISMTACVEGRILIGGPAESAVLKSVEVAESLLKEYRM